MNLKARFVKWLTGMNPEELNKLKVGDSLAEREMAAFSGDEMNETYVFDFLNYNGSNDWMGQPDENVPMGEGGSTDNDEDSSSKKPQQKIKIKPIDVVQELETAPRKINLVNLDDKISILNDKRDLIKQNYAKREISGLIERMEYRKQYSEFKDYYTQFEVTDEEKIDNLLLKYKLVRKKSDIFIPEFPDEAIKTMKEYTKKTIELTGKKPVFYVIAEENDFQKAYQKRDPILLAQSPFGFFWYILGAWDKEMLLLSEL